MHLLSLSGKRLLKRLANYILLMTSPLHDMILVSLNFDLFFATDKGFATDRDLQLTINENPGSSVHDDEK